VRERHRHCETHTQRHTTTLKDIYIHENSLQICEVLSVDALSDIISSKSVNDWLSIDSILFSINFSALNTGRPILILDKGSCFFLINAASRN